MKKLLLFPLAFFCALTFAKAQQLPIPNQAQHSVAVSAVASKSVRPDQIFVSVVIKEFSKDRKVITLAELEKGVRNYAETVCGLAKENTTADAPNPADHVKSASDKNPEKTLLVKCSDVEQAALLFSAMDSLGIERMNIRHLTHSKLEEYREQMKSDAVKNAVKTATTMLSGVNAKPGDLLTLTQRDESTTNSGDYNYGNYSYGSKSKYGGGGGSTSSVVTTSSGDNEVRSLINRIRNYSISVSFSVSATFAIQKL